MALPYILRPQCLQHVERTLVRCLSTEAQTHRDLAHDRYMQAWQIHAYGKLPELQLTETAKIPVLSKPNQILVKVSAASVNPIDVAVLGGYGKTVLGCLRDVEGVCQAGRGGPSPEFPLTLGRDFAGEVAACGLAVQGLKPGDPVWGVIPPHQQGSHAEFVLAPAHLVCKQPIHLTPTEACSLPYAAMTAWSALWISAGLCVWPARAQRVLLLGGSGGVGTAALQILKAWAAHVVTTCQGDAVPLLESLGADAVIDYTKPDADKLIREEGPYDIVLNASGQQGTPHLENLKQWQMARYVTVSSPLLRNVDQLGLLGGGLRSALDLVLPNLQGVTSRGATVRWAFFTPLRAGMQQITKLTNTGKMNPVIDSTFDFQDLPAAYQRQLDGHIRGKVVVSMDSPSHDQP